MKNLKNICIVFFVILNIVSTSWAKPILYAPFEDANGGNGSTTKDWAGNSTCQLVGMNTTDSVSGVVGKALLFFGGGGHVDCGTTATSLLGDNVTNLSVTVLFKSSKTGGSNPMFNIGTFANSEGEFAYRVNTNRILVRMKNNALAINISFTDTANYHLLTTTYDGVNVRVYLDSVERATKPFSQGLNFAGLKTIIGAYYASPYTFNGTIDEVRIYNYALLSEEVNVLYRTFLREKIGANSATVKNNESFKRDSVGNICIGKQSRCSGLLID